MNRQQLKQLNPAELMRDTLTDTETFVRRYRAEKRHSSKTALLMKMAPALRIWRHEKELSYAEIAALLTHHQCPVSAQTVKAAYDRLMAQQPEERPDHGSGPMRDTGDTDRRNRIP